MTGLLDGATVPWHIVSGRHEPGITISLPAPVRRDIPWTPEQVTAIGHAMRDAGMKAGAAMRRLADAFKELPQENT